MLRYSFATLLLLAACQASPTPFPVDIPVEATATPTPSAPLPVRYALDANTSGFIADIDLIASTSQVEQLTAPANPDDLGSRYDLVAAYGDWSGWTRSPITPHVALLINPEAPPLDIPALAEVVRRSINPDAVLAELGIPGAVADVVDTGTLQTLRVELANMGYPDGVRLTLAYAYTPGIVQVVRQLKALSIDCDVLLMSDAEVGAALDENWAHLALAAWTTPDQRAVWAGQLGEENVLDLYVLPISYRAGSDLTISFSPGGWPIASR